MNPTYAEMTLIDEQVVYGGPTANVTYRGREYRISYEDGTFRGWRTSIDDPAPREFVEAVEDLKRRASELGRTRSDL